METQTQKPAPQSQSVSESARQARGGGEGQLGDSAGKSDPCRQEAMPAALGRLHGARCPGPAPVSPGPGCPGPGSQPRVLPHHPAPHAAGAEASSHCQHFLSKYSILHQGEETETQVHKDQATGKETALSNFYYTREQCWDKTIQPRARISVSSAL